MWKKSPSRNCLLINWTYLTSKLHNLSIEFVRLFMFTIENSHQSVTEARIKFPVSLKFRNEVGLNKDTINLMNSWKYQLRSVFVVNFQSEEKMSRKTICFVFVESELFWSLFFCFSLLRKLKYLFYNWILKPLAYFLSSAEKIYVSVLTFYLIFLVPTYL